MLNVHVEIADYAVPDLLGLLILAGYTPIVVARTCDIGGNDYVLIQLGRTNEVAARAIAAWMRSITGVAHIALEWRQSESGTGSARVARNLQAQG